MVLPSVIHLVLRCVDVSVARCTVRSFAIRFVEKVRANERTMSPMEAEKRAFDEWRDELYTSTSTPESLITAVSVTTSLPSIPCHRLPLLCP